VVGALLGRKTRSLGTVGRVATTMRGAGRVQREKRDVERVTRNLEALREELAELERTFESDLDKTRTRFEMLEPELVEKKVRPRKSDLLVHDVALVWVPFWEGPGVARDASRSAS
jgi:hypothetical protein